MLHINQQSAATVFGISSAIILMCGDNCTICYFECSIVFHGQTPINDTKRARNTHRNLMNSVQQQKFRPFVKLTFMQAAHCQNFCNLSVKLPVNCKNDLFGPDAAE